MRKLLAFIMINLILCMNFFSFAQENFNDIDELNDNSLNAIDDNLNTNTDNDSIETLDNNNKWTIDFADISASFCNEWLEKLSDSLKVAVNQWTPFKVCIVLNNNWDIDADIEIRIVDKVINDQWYEVCDYNNKNIQNFMSQDDLSNLSEIHIPAHNYVIKEFWMNFPIGVNWEQKSCLTYHLISKKESVSMLNVIYNRYHDMDFFVWNVWDIVNKLEINQANLRLNENKFLELWFNIDNIWNLENQVTIHWTMSNIFWFKKDFEFDLWNIWIWWHLTWIVDLWPLPNYGWLFNVTMTATSTPYFSYNIDESSFDKDLLEPKDFTITTSYFQMPWIAIIILIFVIMFIIVAFRKPKKEVVYVQAPQWPMQNNWYQQPQYQAPQQNEYQQPQTTPPQQQYQSNNQ